MEFFINIKSVFVLLLAACTIFASTGCKSTSGGEYGKVAEYSKNKKVKYADFEIEYTGETSKTSTFPNGNSFTFRYQNFKITSGSSSKEIFWTSGTGEIAPSQFEFAGSKYTLELTYCEAQKRKLGEDEMVITKL